MSGSPVLIVTNERDVGADFLVKELSSREVGVVRLNSERAPDWRLSLEPNGGWRILRGSRALRAEDCAGVWWRRPDLPDFAASPAKDAINDQWRAFLAALASVQGPVWVSEPASIRNAENKALQDRVALSEGSGSMHQAT